MVLSGEEARIVKYQELLDLNPKPSMELARPAEELIVLFQQHGHSFAVEGSGLRFLGPYEPGRLAAVTSVLSKHDLDLQIAHSIWPIYENEDYAKAPLWIVRFPPIWMDGIVRSVVCEACGKKQFFTNPDLIVAKVPGKKAIANISGRCDIVRENLRTAIEEALTGVVFSAFDTAGQYCCLSSAVRLSTLIAREDEVLNYRGICPKCSVPQFDMYFGPLRFARNGWNGEDVVWCDFPIAGLVFTPKAFNLFRKFEKGTKRDGIVLLE